MYSGVRDCVSVNQSGAVEGRKVGDIVLDTGCSQTMVHWGVVQYMYLRVELLGKGVSVRCAHGDPVLYPLADLDMMVDRMKLKVTATVSENLPGSVLLGTDVKELANYSASAIRQLIRRGLSRL